MHLRAIDADPNNAREAVISRQTGPAWPTTTMVGAIVILAAIIRFALASQSMWFDEFASVFFASQPFTRLWSLWMVRETNPPLFYSVLRGWMLLVGPMDRAWLRMPSILASLAVIPVMYWGVSGAYGRRAGLVAAVLLAISGQQIAYALQIRAYSMQALALSLSFVGLLQVVRAHERDAEAPISAWALYAGGALAAIYLHTTSVLWPAIASIAVFLVDHRTRMVSGREFRQLFIADLVIAVGAAWWIYVTYRQVMAPNGNLAWLAGNWRWSIELFRSSIYLARSPQDWQKIIPLVVAAAAVLGAIRTWRSAATRLTTACFVTSVVIYFAVSQKQWILIERSMVWMAIFPLTLLAGGIGTIRRRQVLAAAIGLVVGLIGWNAYSKAATYEWEQWSGPIVQMARDPHAVVVVDDDGMAVAVQAACSIELRRSLSCPFPILTVDRRGPSFNGWARGYAPRPHVDGHGRWIPPSEPNLYFIQRFAATTQADFAAAGLLGAAKGGPAFFLGPYNAATSADLARQLRVDHGTLRLVSPSPPTTVTGTVAR